ncbi:MAG TPA: hypothetical protein DC006_06005 [Prevotellaceae bacterium]|nr:hypothetical protein [Prevotellaceae bacterium]
MKKTKLMAMLLMAGLAFTACDEDDDFNPVLDGEQTVTVDFEGSYFSALIDTPQYNGPMLYGELSSNYRWTDPATTLTGGMTNKWGGQYGFSEGGAAISNYLDANVDSLHSYDTQLAVPVSNGSSNFVVVYDEATLSFSDGVAREVKSIDMIGTTYMLSVAKQGNGIARALTLGTDYLNVKIKGFNGTNPTDSVNVALCAAGGFMTKWCTCSIASLGKVTSLKFTMEGSDTGEYGLNTPAYFALDNVVIVK